jgi:hypothetical protein
MGWRDEEEEKDVHLGELTIKLGFSVLLTMRYGYGLL